MQYVASDSEVADVKAIVVIGVEYDLVGALQGAQIAAPDPIGARFADEGHHFVQHGHAVQVRVG